VRARNLAFATVLACGCLEQDPAYLGAGGDSGSSDGGDGTADGGSDTATGGGTGSASGGATGDGGSSTPGETTPTGTTGSSTTGSSSAGGCGEPELLLWTTLEDEAAIQNPEVGTGTEVEFAVTGFQAGIDGQGAYIDAHKDYIRYRQVAEVPNLEIECGTLDVWLKPDFDHTDGKQHNLMRVDGDSRITVRKTGGDDFQVRLRDVDLIDHDTNVPPTDYGWLAGEWLRITVTWDAAPAPGDQNVHIYFDGVEVPLYEEATTDTIVMADESPTDWVYFGATAPDDNQFIDGVLDEAKIYRGIMPP
jgi:hypothetical protein